MRRGSVFLGGLLHALVVSTAATAFAGPEDASAADALFRSARKLADSGNWAEACPKFEASLAMFASASSAINLAQCLQHEGKIASAWGYFGRGLALSRDMQPGSRRDALEALAGKGQRELEPRLPKLRVVVKRPNSGFSVQRDGKDVPVGALGEALPVDPGAHEVRVSAPGFVDATQSVTMREGAAETLEFALTPSGGAPPVAAVGPPTEGGPAADAAPSQTRVWPWVTGGVSLALIGAGVAFLVDDLAAVNALETNCQTIVGFVTCKPGYDSAADNSRKNRDLPLAIAFGATGVVGATVSVIFLATSPKSSGAGHVALAPTFGDGSYGVSIHGDLW